MNKAQDIPPLINNEEEEPQGSSNLNSLGSKDSFSDDTDSEEELDDGEGGESTKCLFCSTLFSNIELALQHLREEHKVDFLALKNKFHMDQYSFIKLINCIRCDDITVDKLLTAQSVFWNDDKYLKPGEYESWLTYDYETQLARKAPQCLDGNTVYTVETLKERVQHYENLLTQAQEDMNKMRGTIRLLMDVDKEASTKYDIKKTVGVASKSLASDEGYFNSYAHFGIHHEMLSDKVRTNSYRNALLQNTEYVSGKDVLDVGCGTGILSIFAAQAGARQVIGIDNSDIIYNAMDIVKNHKVNNVKLVKGRLEDTVLPQEKYDIIISEWMGYFLLFEGMLDSIIYARDRHLAPGGIILPNRCTMSLLGYGNDKLFDQHVTFWDDVYGLNMSNMRKNVLKEPFIDIVDPQHVLTEAHIIADLDMATVTLNYSNFSCNFNMKVTQTGRLSAFVGYFDTFFDLPKPISFSTGPSETPTHWKQVVFFLEKPINYAKNDIISGILTCRRSHNNARSLDISIQIEGQKYNYYLD